MEAAQRLICKEEEGRRSFLVVPYSSPAVCFPWHPSTALIPGLPACSGSPQLFQYMRAMMIAWSFGEVPVFMSFTMTAKSLISAALARSPSYVLRLF